MTGGNAAGPGAAGGKHGERGGHGERAARGRPADRPEAMSGEGDLMARLAAGRPARARRALLVTVGLMSLVVMLLSGGGWVDIPGYGMNKINAAIGLEGPSLAVRTVAQATGLTINDFVQVNFLGFVKLIDTLGGVDICLPFAVSDPDSGLRLSAGRHHVNGVTALEYARDRHSFATSDLARIFDQQQLIATVASQAIRSGTLTDLARISRLMSAVTSMVKIDQGLNVVELASELRSIRPEGITFDTVPLANVDYTTPTGLSAVLWNQPAANALFARIGADQLPPRPHRTGRGTGTHGGSGGPGGPGGPAPAAPLTAAGAACR